MATRRELMEKLRRAQHEMFPVPPHKLRKHELEHAIDALEAGTLAAKSAPPKKAATHGVMPREVRIADVVAGDSTIQVPQAPPKRIGQKSTKAELAAYRESLGPLPERLPKPKAAPKPKKRATADDPTDNPFPSVAPHAAAVPSPVVDEDDPRASRIVRKGAIKKTDKLSLPLAPPKAEAPKGAPPPEMLAAFSAWYASQKA
jgi:hypothetical protein